MIAHILIVTIFADAMLHISNLGSGANGSKFQMETMEKILRQLSLLLALMYLYSRAGK